MRHRRSTLPTFVVIAMTAALAACGSGGGSSSSITSGPPTTASPTGFTVPGTITTTSVSSSGRGWVHGEPDWTASASGGGPMSGAAPGVGPESIDGVVPSPLGAPIGDVVLSDSTSGTPGDNSSLHAGSVDDNADFAGFLDYLARYETLGQPSRPFDPSGRIVITVTGANGLPVAGTAVTISAADQPVAQLRTSADGQAIFLPAEYGAPQAGYQVSAGDAIADAVPGSPVTLTLSTNGGAAAGMPVDVLFLLDVTGSMGDEIAQLKATIADVSARLGALPQQPDIRFGMTLFRDEGDTFVTSTFDFTNDIAAFQSALDDVAADGGGDTPEAVDEAFAAALGDPSWRDPASTVQMIFLVGDAAPQVGRQLQQPYTASIREAASRGVTVNVIAASQTDDPAEHAFREIAMGTGGRFVFLAYGAAGAAVGANSDISSTDYEALSLDDLIVRLVGEELATLTGDVFEAPTTTAVPATNPPGQ